MLTSFSEFKFFQSFRIPIENADELRCSVEYEDDMTNDIFIKDAELVDISVTGLGFKTLQKLKVGTTINIHMQFKKINLDLSGKVVRAFSGAEGSDQLIYGVEIDEDKRLRKFLQTYITSFSVDRLRDCLIDSALTERYTKASDGFEMFSLLLALFKDITYYGDKEGFVENMLQEVVRIMSAQRASIFLINPETNELEAFSALGIDRNEIKFDYRTGIAGSVFTTGVALNIDVENDKTRFNQDFDKKFSFQTRSIICHPIHNREDKIIGVIEVINKRNQMRFSVEDEKTMKVLALIFSSVFHSYNPISEKSQIRRFSTPFDREHAFIGKTPHVQELRNSIIKTKDLDSNVLIEGERSVGKTLMAKILHYEGKRGLKSLEIISCESKNFTKLEEELFSNDDKKNKLISCNGGTVIFHEIGKLNFEFQEKLINVFKHNGVEGSKFSIDVRVVATCSTDLAAMVDEGLFSKELYNFINSTLLIIEPLRRRVDDIEELVDYFLKIECKKQGLLLKNFSSVALDHLKKHEWPGNVDEIRLCVERAVLYNPKAHIISDVSLDNETAPLLDHSSRKKEFGSIPYVNDAKIHLKDRVAIFERELISAEIKRFDGNKSKAAISMGISREALRKKLMVSEDIIKELDKKRISNISKKTISPVNQSTERVKIKKVA